ncbi:MAG: ribonuclease HII [Candidatus Lokiarchaeota archaeon]|nr:ribonuclease HII [Candidatus Lokiarchaeota archaeon]
MIVCGIDEAGKGPVLGPLIVCGLCYKTGDLIHLEEIGVKDSKKLSKQKREELIDLIIEKSCGYKVVKISANEIDEREKHRINLNKLEVIKIVDILNKLKPDIIYVDAIDVDEHRFGRLLKSSLTYTPNKLVSKHKADDLFPIVSAASIIAKVTRDRSVEKLKKKYGDMGSGYSSDRKTIDFLRKWIKTNGKAPEFARRTWKTTKRILEEEVNNTKITDFFS